VSSEKPRNLAASVRQKLFNRAQERHEDFGLVLTKYGLERFLYRLSQSEYRDQFVLKGALLFELWTHRPYRPTRDLDLSGQGDNSIARMKKVFGDVIAQVVEDDGLAFDAKSVRITRIKEEQEYEGLRVNFLARLERARISLQVDIGFGDAIVPDPEEIQYPSMLDFPLARLRAYPKETVVAEKLEALVKLGMVNTRMKDFYDLWILAREFEFSGPSLCKAIEATFQRRQTEMSLVVPLALTQEFSGDSQKRRQWQAFVKKSNLDHHGAELDQVTEELKKFLMPAVEALRASDPFRMSWPKNGPWTPPQNQSQ
jgi:predicted nucleotidyltransferase component of viral defense system